MKNKMTPKNLLQLVEHLAGEEKPEHPEKTLSLIYRIVHGFGDCKHADWQKEAAQLFDKLKELKEI